MPHGACWSCPKCGKANPTTEISCLACMHRRPAYRSMTQKQVDLVRGARPPIMTTDSRSRESRGSERSRVARGRERANAKKSKEWAREDIGDYRVQRELPEEIRLHGTYTATNRFRDAEERQFSEEVAFDAAKVRCDLELRQAGAVLGRASSVSFSPLQVRPGASVHEFERAAQHAWGPKHANNTPNTPNVSNEKRDFTTKSAAGNSALASLHLEPRKQSACARQQAHGSSRQSASEGASDSERPRLYARRKSAIAGGGQAALAAEKGASEDLRAGVVPALNPGARGGEACCGGMGRGQIPRLIRSTLLVQLGSMRKLSMTHNNLKRLPLRIGEMYGPVRELNLAYNQLEQLPSSIALLSRMTTLKLTGNMIKKLPVDMCHHGMQIRKLALESNHLVRLPQTFGRLARLNELRLGYNQITTLPSTFCYLGALQTLDFVANGLMSLAMIPKKRRPPPRCSDGPWDELADPMRPGEIVWVNVSTGEARRTPPNIDAMEEHGTSADEDALEWEIRLPRNGETNQITYVNARTNEQLSRMPRKLDQIGRLVSLRVLRLQDNMLSELGDGFTQLTGLRTLNLSGNPLQKLPELSSFRLLRHLRARDCQLRKCPHTIGHVTGLCSLDLASNFLIELPAAVGLCTNLEALDVSWNALDDLPAGVGFMNKLSVLKTIGNEMGQLLRAMPSASTQKDGGGSGVGLRYVPKTLTTQTVIWCCRQKRLREIRGAPPPSNLRIIKSGLQCERREVEPSAEEAVAKALHDAECCAEARIECRGCRERFGRNRCFFCPDCFWKVHEKRRVRLPRRQKCTETGDSIGPETNQHEYGHDLVERTYYVGNAVHPDAETGDGGETGISDQRIVEEVHDWGAASLVEVDKNDDEFATASKVGNYMRCRRCQQGSGQFAWHWHGLDELPSGLRQRRHLRSIHMTGHFMARENISVLRGLQQLQILSLSSCNLRQLCPELGLQLPRLKTLSLECNQLEHIPESLCRVTTLMRLTLRGNRLKHLPNRLGDLHRLNALQLDSNELETLPDSLPHATALRILSLSHNRLTQLGGSTDVDTLWDWGNMLSLERLKLDDNALVDSAIMPGLERLPRLQDLSLSFNRLCLQGEKFEAWGGQHSCFRTSLLSLTLCNNKIRELPLNFQSLACLKHLFYAGNPIISPPLELEIKPMEKKMKYLRLRSERLQEIVRYLRSAKFEVDETALRPVTKNLVTGGAGFLLEGDLEDLDDTVDRYVNGPFYMFIRDRASTIVSALSELRKMRQQDSYKKIVDSTLAVIREELAARRHGQSTCIWDNELVDPVVRPLGHKGEDVLCYALAHSALFGDVADRGASSQHRRPPVIDQVRDRVASSMSLTTSFAGSNSNGSAQLKSRRSSIIRWHDEFSNALSDYEAPFGYGGPQRRVAILHDEDNFPPGAQKALPALVIVRIVYSAEEAERRSAETTLYNDRQRSLLDRMREWFLEGDGFDVLHKETARRLMLLPERLRFWRQQLKVLTPFVNKSIHGATVVSNRATKFNRRMIEVLHSFPDNIDKDAALEAADIDLQEVGDGYNYARAKMVDAEAQLKYTVEMRTDRAMHDIEPKLRDLTAREVVRAGRLKAWRNRLRRPWDGDDGAEYDAWLKKRAMQVEVHVEDTIPGEYQRAEVMKQKEKVVLAEDLHPLDEKSQWTWEGVEWL